MKPKSVLLLGSYGQSNLGDDLLMWNYLELLRDRGFKNIYVNANTTEFIPAPVKKAYPDLHIVDTYNTSIIEYIKIIKKVDCIVYGGGTLYKELYSSTGRSKYSVIIRMMGFNVLAKLLGTKLYHLNIGIGALKTWTGRFISKLALGASTLTIFRDQESYDFAKEKLHIAPDKIKKSTDGLFLNHIWEKPWEKATLSIDRTKWRNVIGINVLSDIPDWVDRDHYIKAMQQFVTKRLDQGDYIVFVPFQHRFNPRNDLLFTEETFAGILKDYKNYTLLDEVPIEQASSYLQQCDLFIGMRFHSLLLSTVNQVPFVAIAYDTKCWRFIKEVRYEYAIRLEDLQLKDLDTLCNDALIAKSPIKKQLAVIANQTYAEAEEDIRTLSL
ncbi:MAG TPA: polysaccharide pyruvyl transferase family protein [Candidatus Saccharimonadales bacterium]|nr:polysaccharide pyruvyl transferase family protein [Candidatus Saccharimonadales bacterium]